jgi:phosphohistidine phosphatase SixA
MRIAGGLVAVCLLTFAAVAQATPAEILLIRHGEKDGGPDLSERGRERAEALVSFFQTNPAVTTHGVATVIYAAAPKHEGSSNRAVETIQPLADALGIAVDSDYTSGEYSDMVDEVMSSSEYDGQVVLICWHHGKLPDIAEALGISPKPADWDDTVFDRVWRLDFKGDQLVSFTDLPQHLLPGDSPQ